MPAPSILSVTTTLVAAASTSHVLNAPAGVTTGTQRRLLLAVLSTPLLTSYTSGPAGWTRIYQGSRTRHLELWAKVATDSEPATYTWTHPSSVKCVGTIYYIDDVEPDFYVGAEGLFFNSTITFTGVTTQGPDCLILQTATLGATQSPVTPSANTTERVDVTTGAVVGSDIAQFGQTLVQAAQGATGTKTATASVADGFPSYTLSLFPDSGNRPPTAAAMTSKTCRVGDTVSFTASGSDPDGTVTYNWTRASATGPTPVDATSATMSVTATSVGAFTYRVTVTDSGGATAFRDVGLVVVSPPPRGNALSVMTAQGPMAV